MDGRTGSPSSSVSSNASETDQTERTDWTVSAEDDGMPEKPGGSRRKSRQGRRSKRRSA